MRRSRGFAVPAGVLVALALVLSGSTGPSPVDDPGQPTESGPTADLRDLPAYFVENRGQAGSSVEYYLHGADTSVGFSSGGVLVSLADRQGTSQRWNLGLEFVGARPVRPVGRGRTPAVVSYFRGNPEDWHAGLPTYSQVTYRDLWPGIDLVYRGTGSRLKYSLLVEPGADPSDIRLAWRGAAGLSANDRGQLTVQTPAGDLVEDTPFTYQEVDGRRVEVPSAYSVPTGTGYGFDLGPYDPSRPLVIDPAMLVYAGFIGGSNTDRGYDVAVDGTGAAYVTGEVLSTEATFPDGDGLGTLPGPDGSWNGGDDAFVAKVNPAGTALVYAGYIGGAGVDETRGIAVDGSGAAYVAGFTNSTDATFPEVTGPDLTYNMGLSDAFVAKLAPTGTSLAYAGYIGGSELDSGLGIAVDGMGAAYVTGSTSSSEATFPDTVGPDTTYNLNTDAFVAKVAPSGASLTYAGYIGGLGFDLGDGIAVDGAQAAYVTGTTDSGELTFPEVGGPDTSYNGGPDAFVAKVAPAGTALSYAGYIGGSTEDYASDVAVDGGGAAYVVGFTDSPQASFPDGDGFGPLTGPDTTYNGDPYDAFVVKVVPAGSSLGYAGYVGGSGDEAAQSVAVDGGGAAYLTGRTDSTEDTFPDGDGFGPLTGPDPTYNGGLADVFVAQVAAAGTSFASAGYLGGAAHDQGLGIAVDGTGAAYVTGETGSNQDTFPDGDGLGPLPGPDTTQNSMEDAFVAKIAEPAQPIGATCRGKTATVVGTPGNDTLTGTSGRDVVAALGGKDKVRTLGGKDLVCAGGGNDTANGGGGKDKLFGEGGKDRLKGAGGNDRLNGGPKKDTCVGGPGKRDKARKCEKEKSIP